VRILLDYRPALRQRTGVGEYVHELARALQATSVAGESVSLFSASWRDRLAPDAVPGLTVRDRRIPVRLLNLLWHRLEWPSVETLTWTGFDVVQSAHPLLVPARRAAQLVTIYDLDFLDHPERTRAEVRRDYPVLAGAHARRADRVITISRDSAGQIESRLGVPAAKIVVCTPGAPAWSRRLSEPPDGCILFFGTLEPRKNLGGLLDAYELLLGTPGTSAPALVLAGRLPSTADPLLERTRRPPLAGHVEVTGYVPDADRPALYDRAMVLALPSHTEGFGLPAVEAMTRGVPVVAANRGALPDVVGQAGRLIDPDQPRDLARALRDLLDDRSLRDHLRELGWRQASRFSWKDSAARLRDAWRAAAESRRGSGA
jgi:glycosyltransferase involved in cell wall biosynthesis